MVSAGENLVITSPADEVELKASVVPAPPAGESVAFLWDQWVSLVDCSVERAGFDAWVGKIPWRRKWQPTPVFLPGKFHGWRSLAGYSP